MTTPRGARRLAAGLSFFGLLLVGLAPQDDATQRLKERLNDLDPVGSWFYDDFDAASVEAKRSGKPLMIVFR